MHFKKVEASVKNMKFANISKGQEDNFATAMN